VLVGNGCFNKKSSEREFTNGRKEMKVLGRVSFWKAGLNGYPGFGFALVTTKISNGVAITRFYLNEREIDFSVRETGPVIGDWVRFEIGAHGKRPDDVCKAKHIDVYESREHAETVATVEAAAAEVR
jgi:hypothetical protein